jgi:hypothetical protein
MNTVLSKIKKWNSEYSRKLDNHINALAVNLLDNSKTTHRLKNTLPDRPEQNTNTSVQKKVYVLRHWSLLIYEPVLIKYIFIADYV